MFFVVKKNDVLFILCIICLSFFMLNSSLNYENSQPVFALLSSGKTVIIDAGHGDIDGGAVGIKGTTEKDINLKIALKLQALLEKSGTTVYLTRSDDKPIVDTEGKTVRQIKRDDLKERKRNRDEGNGEIFLSIHMNKFPDSKYYGAQVFYASSPDNSKVLGETIQKNMVEFLDKSNTRKAKKAENSIYILKDSKIPSVIVECGFLSNEKEEKLLGEENYQQKVAWSIFAGVQEYFNTLEK